MTAAHDTTAAPDGTTTDDRISREELQLAARNHGMPLEALRHDITPVGLHYLLVHYDIPLVDPAGWTLEIGGAVQRPSRLDLDDLRRRESVTRAVTMECAGNGRALLSPRALSQPWLLGAVGTGEWTGTPLWPLLEDAGLDADVVDIVCTGLDRGVEGGHAQAYERSITPAQVRDDGALLVYGLNGSPLPPQHGYPLRLLVPGWYGMTSVKWLSQLTAVTEPFAGYQQAQAYRMRTEPGDPGAPVRRIAVRSLMVPPGVPDFFTRVRHAPSGRTTVTGRAWSGTGTIARVEFSFDGGANWVDADVAAATVEYAWQAWRVGWHATEGTHELVCRATDTTGAIQPTEHVWNLGGYAVNTVQRVQVTVGDTV